jgi:glycosyltransferase involved in cell wall biosynthesis
MRVAKKFQGQGYGRRILADFEAYLDHKDIHKTYCIPYAHLERFYGAFGFKKAIEANVPSFLQDRLRYYSENSRGRLATNAIRQYDGLFVDQLWLNLLPLFFDNVYVSKDEVFNLGHWNLWQGDLSLGSSCNTAFFNGKPVSILHFSGLNPLDLPSVSRYSTLYLEKPNQAWALLAEDYIFKSQLSRYKLNCQVYPYLAPASCSQKIPIFIELSVLGLAELNNPARTGIFFYIRNVIESLSRRDDIQLIPFCGDYSLLPGTLSASNNLKLDSSLLQEDPVVKRLFFLSFWLSHNSLYYVPFLRRLLRFCSSAFSSLAVKLYHHKTYSLIRNILLDIDQESSKPNIESTRRSRLAKFCKGLFRKPPKKALVHFTYTCYAWITAPRDLNLAIQRVVTSYDLTPLLHPEICDLIETSRFKEFLHSLRPTDYVLSTSNSTKIDLLNALPCLDKARVFVAPLAASNAFKPHLHHESINQSIALRPSGSLLPSRYILSVATLELRVNSKLLLEAFANVIFSIPECDVSLLLIGGEDWVKDNFRLHSENLGISDRVVLAGYLLEEEVHEVYSQALFFVYPSLYEGFGLPVLEAMQCGLPVITSDSSSLAEIASNAALLVDVSSVDQLSTAIKTLVLDATLRDRLGRAGIARASAYSWTSTISAIVEAYKIALAAC